MPNTSMTPTDLELSATVMTALRGQLGAAAAHIMVMVQDGVVALEGIVATGADKLAAETTAQRVPGVLATA